MNETLSSLLLQLSEAGAPASLWGRRAKPHFGRGFDRLLASGVLVEEAPAETWSTCATCDCDLFDRPIERIGDKLLATCPFDPGSDTVLEPDDLRSFLIDERRLVETLAGADLRPEPVESLPGLWRLSPIPDGRAAFLTLRRAIVEHPALLAVMRADARSTGIVLIAPQPSGAARQRLQDAADVRLVALDEAAAVDGTGRVDLDAVLREASSGPGPRLVLNLSAQTVLVDGVPQPVPPQPFRLLALLAERAKDDGAPLDNRAIYETTGREARDLIRELRDALAAGRADKDEIRGWIKARRSLGAFELALRRDHIDVRP